MADRGRDTPTNTSTMMDAVEQEWPATTVRGCYFHHKQALFRLAEGWHHGFHSMLSCNNPTIWKFLDCLKAEQSQTDVKLTRRLLRQPPEKRAAKWIKYDQRLRTIVDSYDDYDIEIFLTF